MSRAAVYLESDGPHGRTVIALLARDAVRLPNGLVLADTQSVAPFADVARATSVRIGRCSVVFDGPAGPRTVRVGRWWRPRRPRPVGDPRDAAPAVDRLAQLLSGATGGLSASATRPLTAAVADPGHADRACARLVGAGPGLTPSGDDLLCGFLLAAGHLCGPHRFTALASAAVRRAAGGTTAVSAALIGHATRGESCPEVTDLLDALSGYTPLAPALAALRAVGHTSGTDLALGALAGARAALEPRRPHQHQQHPQQRRSR